MIGKDEKERIFEMNIFQVFQLRSLILNDCEKEQNKRS